MKVILLENVKRIGSIGEVIDVKRGFARNFLISNKKALYASKENIKEVEKIKSNLAKKDNEKKAEAQKISEQINLKEYSIVGRKDEKWGEVPVIVAVRKNLNVLPEEILKLFKGKVANYKIPKDVLFVNALPRNALGKIVIDEVKELVI